MAKDETNTLKQEDTEEDVKVDETKGGNEKVPLSEEFQREVIALTSKASKDECDFICDKAYQRQDELRKDEEVDMDDYKEAMSPD